MQLRRCSFCGKILPETEFTGEQRACKTCRRDYDWQRRYGISPEQYLKLYKMQGGRCRICGKELPEGHYLSVDHNKATGDIRGLLCSDCNLGLGCFMDDVRNLENAILYLGDFYSEQL